MDKIGLKNLRIIIKRCLHLPFSLFPLGKRKSGGKIFSMYKSEENIYTLASWINKQLEEDLICVVKDNEIQIIDKNDKEIAYWFDLENFSVKELERFQFWLNSILDDYLVVYDPGLGELSIEDLDTENNVDVFDFNDFDYESIYRYD